MTRTRRLKYGRLGPALLLWLFLAAGCAEFIFHGHSSPAAVPAPAFNALFTRNADGWTGGDGTLSIDLPDGRTVWLFGDSFLGTVSEGGERAPDTPFIRNGLVVQHGGYLETRFDASRGIPSDFFAPPSPGEWFWPGHGAIENGALKIFLHRFRQDSPELWKWRWIGNSLATLSLPDLEVTAIDPAPGPNGVLYGVSVLKDESYTYIFGASDGGPPVSAYLARTRADGLSGPWSYFSDGRWSETPGDARPVLKGVSTQYAVVRFRAVFYLVTMDARIPFSADIAAYRAPHPTGPWTGPVVFYRVPEASPDIAAYNPFVHRRATKDGRILVSYNLNHVADPSAVYRDAAIYRPRFIWVDLAAIDRLFVRDGNSPE